MSLDKVAEHLRDALECLSKVNANNGLSYAEAAQLLQIKEDVDKLRDMLIIHHRNCGMSLQGIGLLFTLTEARISQICKQEISTVIAKTNPDENGFYEVPLGLVTQSTNYDILYAPSKNAPQLTSDMRRLTDPNYKEPGMLIDHNGVARDNPNSNSVVYSPETLFRSVSSFNQRIAGGIAFGEMGTPKKDPEESENSFYSRYIGVIERDVALMSGKIDIKSQEDGNVVLMGKIKPLATPHGSILEEMLKTPSTVNFAIRALQKNNELVFVTVDAVSSK